MLMILKLLSYFFDSFGQISIMKNLLPILVFFIVAWSACQSESASAGSQPSLEQLFENYYQRKLKFNPIEATKAGEYQYNDEVANYISEPYKKELLGFYTKFLQEADKYEPASLSPSDRLSLEVLKWECAIKSEGLQNQIATISSPMYDLPSFELMPINQMSSLHLYFSQLAGGGSVQPFKTVEDYDNWLHRVDDFLTFIDTVIVNMKDGIARDIVLPKVIIQRTIDQLDPFINTAVEDHVFFAPVQNMPESFSKAERQRLGDAFREMISGRLIPKYRVLQDFLKDPYLPAGRESSGIGTLPHGRKTYDYLIRLHTTTNMTADEIFTLGQSEVKRIAREMETVKKKIGFEGDLKEFFNHVRNDKLQMPFTEPQEVIDNFNVIHAKMKGRLSQLFELEPKAGFEVKRTEAFREASASAEYVPGSKDGSRPGTFYVPIPDVTRYNKFADEALFLHEAIPGHHYQLSLQQENEDLPAFLHAEGMGVFVEGWALYAESLGKELGLYDDPYQYFGMLSMEMHRAIRLVVDVGLHAKGWTREQAIQFSLENEAESESSITAEIERYMIMPGQALSYKIGQLKIRELRTRAEETLGEDFDIRAFHTQVLNSGSLPLMLLEEKINGWIEAQRSD